MEGARSSLINSSLVVAVTGAEAAYTPGGSSQMKQLSDLALSPCTRRYSSFIGLSTQC